MCECWEFNCGHTTRLECQDHKNRFLHETDKEVVRNISEGDDPFTDPGTQASDVKERTALIDSNSNQDPPPQFLLPSPTPSSVKSDTDGASPVPSIRVEDTACEYGPSSAAKNTESSITPKSPTLSPNKKDVCGGPDRKTRKVDDECYTCILQKAKNNSAFQQDERAAEIRLHEEINRQDNNVGGADQHEDNGDSTDNVGGDENSHTWRTLPRGSPVYANDAVDLGRGDPPRGPRYGSTAPGSTTQGNTHHASNRAPIPQHFQAHNAYWNQPSYQGIGTAVPTFNPIDMAYQNEGSASQYAFQDNANQYLQAHQQNPYQYPLELYGTPSPYQQSLYQVEMDLETQFPDEELQYDIFGYPYMNHAGYGFYPGM